MRKIKLKFKILFLIILIIIVFFSFKINKIDVINNKNHTNEEIINMVFKNKFDKLFFVCLIKSKLNDGKYDYPNIERIDVNFKNPFYVVLNTLEKPVLAYIRFNDDFYYFDEDLYILNDLNYKDENMMELIGITIGKNSVHTYLNIDNDNVKYILKKISELKDIINMPIITIDFTDLSNIKLLSKNIDVNVGKGDYIEEKISLLIDIYPEIKDLNGTLDLSNVNKANDRGEYIFKKR